MKALLNKIHPVSGIFFVCALFMVAIGFATNFEHRILHVGSVVGCVVSGLLIQRYGLPYAE
jgi:hypothetical protein